MDWRQGVYPQQNARMLNEGLDESVPDEAMGFEFARRRPSLGIDPMMLQELINTMLMRREPYGDMSSPDPMSAGAAELDMGGMSEFPKTSPSVAPPMSMPDRNPERAAMLARMLQGG